MQNNMHGLTKPDLWLKCPRPSTPARIRLFCFPYAGGGGAVYRPWLQEMPAGAEIWRLQLPGRENRMGEKPFHRFLPLLHAVTRSLARHIDLPFAFFGHSMGALLAFEAARLLRKQHHIEPLHLFVSGCLAPQFMWAGRIADYKSDAQLVEALRVLQGTPPAVLENPELLQLFLPLLRADFAVCASYRYLADAPLSCPITACGGLHDPQVSSADLVAWRHQTCSLFRHWMLPGDHFYLHEHVDPLVSMVYNTLMDSALLLPAEQLS